MVGNKSSNSTYVGYLKNVVGPIEWNGSVNGDGTINVGNAATADLFKGEFESLGPILRSILIAECGGTLTVQKRIDTGGSLDNPTSGKWSYTTDLGVRELDRATTSSITFDYSFGPGEVTKQVQIVEAPAAGYVWERAECTAGGNPVSSEVERRRITRRHRHCPSRPGRVLPDDLEASMSTSFIPDDPALRIADSQRRDEGSVLPMILALMVVGSLSVVALLTFATTLFINRPPIEERDRTFWTAKSAMSMAMTLQREYGPDGCYPGPYAFSLNGFTANVTCTPTANYFGTGRGRFAVITTSNDVEATQLTGSGAGAAIKPIVGDVLVNGGVFDATSADLGVQASGAGVPANVLTSNFASAATPVARYNDPSVVPSDPPDPLAPPPVTDCSNPAVAAAMTFPNPGTAWSSVCQAQPWWELAGDLNTSGTLRLSRAPAIAGVPAAQCSPGDHRLLQRLLPRPLHHPAHLGAGSALPSVGRLLLRGRRDARPRCRGRRRRRPLGRVHLRRRGCLCADRAELPRDHRQGCDVRARRQRGRSSRTTHRFASTAVCRTAPAAVPRRWRSAR